MAYWAPPRGTADVDLNVFVGAAQPQQVEAALDVLASVGVLLDRSAAWKEIEQSGCVGRSAVDGSFDSIPLHDSAASRIPALRSNTHRR